MNEIFNPSLIISLGPSSEKALSFSKKLLSHLPKHFLDVIDYYNINSLENIEKDIQGIIDDKLLAAKYLNKLVDLGYKVRSENVNSVRINLYLIFDAYYTEVSAHEVVKILSGLNYANIDKDQHSGVSLFIIPLMEKEWLVDEASSVKSINRLKDIIDFVSDKDNMLSIDSKVYALHCVSNDGTRIPIKELQYICGIITYLNILPSKDPPLSHFNQRILMNEGGYKLGTIGITTLTVFKDKLLDDFSKYLSIDILKHAINHEVNRDYSNNKVFHLVDYEIQKNSLMQNVSIMEEEGRYVLSKTERFEIKLPKDIAQYPSAFKNWEQSIEQNYLKDIKDNIDRNSNDSLSDVYESIEEDVRRITLNESLKEAVNYINTLERKIVNQKSYEKSNARIDISKLNNELQMKVDSCPNIIGYIVKCIILGVFFIYSMLNFELSLFILIALFGVFFVIAYLDYWFILKKINIFAKRYKEAVLEKGGEIIKGYIENRIVENQKTMQSHLARKRQILLEYIKNCEEACKNIVPEEAQEESFGNLITDLLDFNDRERFYKEKTPVICDVYRLFLVELKNFEKLKSENLAGEVLNFSLKISPDYIDLDFYEYMKFKYKNKINEELSLWIEKGVVKSKYLLQFVNNHMLEEHALFITSPQVYNVAKIRTNESLSNFQVSIIESKDIYTNCISIMRLCLGVDFNDITPVKETKRREYNV